MRKTGIQFRSGFAAALLVAVLVLTVAVRGKRSDVHDIRVPEELSELQGAGISGVTAKSPDDSVTIFLNSYFGVNFGSYHSEERFDEAFAKLQNHSVTAMWVSDVTADYLTRREHVKALRPKEQPGQGGDRFSFAFAFRPENTELLEQANGLLRDIRSNGELDRLTEEWMSGQGRLSDLPIDGKRKPLYIGVTGTVPPLEIIERDGTVSGMAVELAARVAERMNRRPVYVILDNETAFARLMAGKVDMLACYGTSENHSTEFPAYRMSDGYIGVTGYSMLVNDYGSKDTVDNGMMTMIKDNLIAGGAYSLILKAIAVTVAVFIGAVICAALFGMLLHAAGSSRNRVAAGFAGGVSFLFRSVPVLLLLLLLDFGIFGGAHRTGLLMAVLAIGLYGAGCLSDMLAGTEEKSFEGIFLAHPKEWKRLVIQLLQWTTVAGYIGLNDITAVMRGIGNRTMYPAFSIVFTILFYLAMVVLTELVFCLLLRRYAVRRGSGAQATDNEK